MGVVDVAAAALSVQQAAGFSIMLLIHSRSSSYSLIAPPSMPLAHTLPPRAAQVPAGHQRASVRPASQAAPSDLGSYWRGQVSGTFHTAACRAPGTPAFGATAAFLITPLMVLALCFNMQLAGVGHGKQLRSGVGSIQGAGQPLSVSPDYQECSRLLPQQPGTTSVHAFMGATVVAMRARLPLLCPRAHFRCALTWCACLASHVSPCSRLLLLKALGPLTVSVISISVMSAWRLYEPTPERAWTIAQVGHVPSGTWGGRLGAVDTPL